MTTIKAIVRNGRIEVNEPIHLPDGTQLTIPIPEPGQPIQDLPESPEAMADWIRWYDSLEPLEFTDDERAAWEAARREQKEFELAQWKKRSQNLESNFP